MARGLIILQSAYGRGIAMCVPEIRPQTLWAGVVTRRLQHCRGDPRWLALTVDPIPAQDALEAIDDMGDGSLFAEDIEARSLPLQPSHDDNSTTWCVCDRSPYVTHE